MSHSLAIFIPSLLLEFSFLSLASTETVVSKIFLSRLHSCKQKNLYVYSYNRTLQAVVSTCQYERRSSVLSDGPSCYNVPRRWHVGHSHHHEGRSGAEGEKIFRIGLCFAAGKAFTGYVSGSTAIIADASHSISDVVLSGAALVSFKAGRVPKDKEHPYGHF